MDTSNLMLTQAEAPAQKSRKRLFVALGAIGMIAVFAVVGSVVLNRDAPEGPTTMTTVQVEHWVDGMFQKWTAKYGKAYANKDEANDRLLIFRDNVNQIRDFYAQGP